MPFRYIVDAVRDVFTGDFGAPPSCGATWAVALFVVALWWGASVFRKENA